MTDKMPLESFEDLLPEDVAALAHEIWQEINLLQKVWGCFLSLYAESEDRIALLNESSGHFFRLVQTLLQHEIWLSVSRLTDPAKTRKRTNSSFPALLAELKGNEHEEVAKTLQERVENLLERVEPFRSQRNRVVAHADLGDRVTLRDEGLPGIEKGEIESVITEISSLFNEIEKAIGRGSTAFDYSRAHAGADEVVYRLEQAKAKIEDDKGF